MTRASSRPILLALALDVIAVVVFAALGRATHDGDVLGPGGLGLAETSWPFLVALALGWGVSLAWRRPLAPVRTGIPVWLVTVVGGMLLRAATGQGTPFAFVIVTTIVLGLVLVGWRVVATVVARRLVPDRQ
ncbi:DUF3054 domain-containing protein [Labedella phragmitis]|uniref:DUF3054 domain-containing protein n=1 Tax=Labedella phragmitis TaxID=2498849 RepID=A0A444PX27_9MICO|nr:DUF3054 domain-containing protein [Labedella phragmitis]RWZ52425.1 DUF3054 domain-containing protein [Labedella phragmitis]